MDGLLYVDSSPRGEWALAVAALLRPDTRFRLWLLATTEDAKANPGLFSAARARLGTEGLAGEAVLRGPAERAVGEAVRARAYSLVIVPPAGRNAVQRMLKGSRVATVVHSVRAPVLVARRPPERLTRVLAALSGGSSTESVCAAAVALAQRLGAQVVGVHVTSEVALPFGRGESPASADEPDVPLLARAREVLQRMSPGAVVVRREGLVVDEVLEELDHGAHQLLVIGAAHDDAKSWGREDVTERLLLGCPASTLVVPPAGLQLE
jgi:nucleotide-binding universal stress UspA family protein